MTCLAADDCVAGMAPDRGYVRVGGVQSAYLVWGDRARPVLVLLHGITSSARAWWRVAPRLAELGYCVYAFDMPGHGASDAISSYHIDHTAALIAAACDALALEQITVLGHSWGGAAALALASTGAALVQRVVLIDPLLKLDVAWGGEAFAHYGQNLGLPPDRTWSEVREDNPDWHACDVFWKTEALHQCREMMVQGVFTGGGSWDLVPRLARISCPLLVLVADLQATIIDPATLDDVRGMLGSGDAEVAILAGTDHNMLRGGFAVTMPVLLMWLEKAAPGALLTGDAE